MAYEKVEQTITLDIVSTGVRQFRFVTHDSTSGVDLPNASTVGAPVTGVLISSGTTGSTDASRSYGVVQTAGVAKVEAEASTKLVLGALVSASSVGRAQPATNAGDFVVGRVVSGSTGAANHIVSVHLLTLGSSTPSTALV